MTGKQTRALRRIFTQMRTTCFTRAFFPMHRHTLEHTNIHAHAHAHTHTCAHSRTFLLSNILVVLSALFTISHVHLGRHTNMHAHTHTHTNTHAHILAYTHTHIYALDVYATLEPDHMSAFESKTIGAWLGIKWLLVHLTHSYVCVKLISAVIEN